MVYNLFSTCGNHFNPNEPRDERGRWTAGGSSNPSASKPGQRERTADAWESCPLRDPSRTGRAGTLLGHALLGLGPARNGRYRFVSEAEAKSFGRVLHAWNKAAGLDDQAFHDIFLRRYVADLSTTRKLRAAAADAAQAQTYGQMVEASRTLTQAIKEIDPDRWTHMLDALEDTAKRAVVPRLQTRRTSLDHEDQPIDSERSTPSGLLQLAASGMNLHKPLEGHFQLASDFNSKPVPFLDEQGRPVIGASAGLFSSNYMTRYASIFMTFSAFA